MSITTDAVGDLKRAFYFVEQRATCYLRIDPICAKWHGAMSLGRNGNRPRFATWDHLRARADNGGDANNQLLACSACNNLKASFALATEADFALAKALHVAWCPMASVIGSGLSGARPGALETPTIDVSSLFCAKNALARHALARRCGLAQPDATPWIKNGDGEKVMIVARPPQPAPKAKPSKRQMPAIEATPARSTFEAAARGGQVAKPRVVDYTKNPNAVAERELKAKRAAELGVTDDRFLPGAKTREQKNAESVAAAHKGIAERARRIFARLGKSIPGRSM